MQRMKATQIEMEERWELPIGKRDEKRDGKRDRKRVKEVKYRMRLKNGWI